MIDKIGLNGALNALKADNTRSEYKTAATQNSETPRRASAPTGSLAAAVEHMVQQNIPIDLDHVMSVRTAIANGQYPVDAQKLAQNILEFDQPSGPNS